MTAHGTEEMAEDDLTIVDIEHAILTGRVVLIQKDDPRGNKLVIKGPAEDSTTMVVVGRFHDSDRFLIVTVYRIAVV